MVRNEPLWNRASLERIASFLAVAFLTALKDPRVGLVRNLGHEGKVVPTEALRSLPIVAVLVKALKGDVVTGEAVNFVRPNRSLHVSEADFMHWSVS